MTEFRLEARSAFAGFRYEAAGTRIQDASPLSIITLSIPKGGEAAMAGALKDALDRDIPGVGEAPLLPPGDWRLLRAGGERLMLLGSGPVPQVLEAVTGSGYPVDQSHFWGGLKISGPLVAAMLERTCRLDLARLPVDGMARTSMDAIASILIRTSEDSFLLLCPRSYAASFSQMLVTSLNYVADMGVN